MSDRLEEKFKKLQPVFDQPSMLYQLLNKEPEACSKLCVQANQPEQDLETFSCSGLTDNSDKLSTFTVSSTSVVSHRETQKAQEAFDKKQNRDNLDTNSSPM